MKLYLSILICYLFTSFSAYTQPNLAEIDSLKKVLLTEKEDSNKVKAFNLLASYYWNSGDQDSARFSSYKAIALSQKIKYPQGEANAYVNLGFTYLTEADYDKGVIALNNAIKISDSLHDKTGSYKANFAMGRLYERAGNYPDALKYQYQSLRLAKETKNIYHEIDALGAIGYIYADEHDLPEAQKNFETGLKFSIELGDSMAIAVSSKNLADIYLEQGNVVKSLPMLLSAKRIFESFSLEEYIAWTNYSLGTCYLKMADSEESMKKNIDLAKSYTYFELSKRLYQQLEDKSSEAECHADIGNVLIKLKRFQEAKSALQSSLALSLEIRQKENIKKTYQLLSKLDSVEGNYKQAYQNYKLYSVYNDSLSDEETAKKAIREKFQYEFEEKTAEKKREQDRKDAEQKRIKNQQYFAIAALGIIVLAVVIIAFIQFRNNKQKQKVNVLLQQQKEKVESTLSELKSTQAQLIQSEKMASLGELTAGIAHEIQNPLNFVNNFSDVNKELLIEMSDEIDKGNLSEVKSIAKDVIDNEEKINHHGKRAEAIVKGMLQHSRSSSGVKEPTDINKLADEYLRLAYHGLRAKDKSFNATLKTEYDESIGNINIISQDIGRVILNLITNAFYAVSEKKKHIGDGYEPVVSVSTKKSKDKVEIRVKDNGNGIPQKVLDKIFQPFFTTKPTGQGTGLGLSLSYDIIKAHGGEIKVETREGEGSVFITQLSIV